MTGDLQKRGTMAGYLELMLYRVYAELKAESSRYYASFLWWIIEPAIYMSAFYVVFGVVLDRGGDGYVFFLLCGITVWKWFANTVGQGGGSIPLNMALIRQVSVPKFIFPAVVVITNTLRFTIVLLLFIFVMLISGIEPALSWFTLPAWFVIQLLFNAACAGIASVITPFIPDMRLLIEKMLMVGFFLSGIFYDVGLVPDAVRFFFLMNPMALTIGALRTILIHGNSPNWVPLGIVFLLSVIALCLVYGLFLRLDQRFPRGYK